MRKSGTFCSLATALVFFSVSAFGASVPHAGHPELLPSRSLLVQQSTGRSGRSVSPLGISSKKSVHHSFENIVSRLQSLGYLPLTHAFIHGRGGVRIRHDAFLWSVPHPLQIAVDEYAWNPGNPFIRGAVVQFERYNGILGPLGVSEGTLHAAVVRRLFSDSVKRDPVPWEWVYVTKANGSRAPEMLHIYERGTHRVLASFGSVHRGVSVKNGWVWGTVVNTGVLGSTPNGTYLVYQRLPKTTMRGVFPIPISMAGYNALAGQQVPQWAGSKLMQSARGMVNGHPVRWQPYQDPGILWVNYFDAGRGIHYYPRASYGFPQSAGCVEEPYSSAPVTYRLLHYGVPVTISGNAF